MENHNQIDIVEVNKNSLLGLFWELKVTDAEQIKSLMEKKYLYFSHQFHYFVTITYPVFNWNLMELEKLTSQQLLDLYLELKK